MTDARPWGAIGLGALTLLGSVAQSVWGVARLSTLLGVAPADVLHPAAWFAGPGLPLPLTGFTHLFVHGGWWHVVPNLTALVVFGAIAEPALGTRRYLATYFASGWVGVVGMALIQPDSHAPIAGASLAVSGTLGVFAARRLCERGAPRWLPVPETLAALGMAAWIGLRTPPAAPGRFDSLLYHFLPFLVLWLATRLRHRTRSTTTATP